MKVVLFIGTKIGYEGLKSLIHLGADIECVFIDHEHAHEIEKYFEKSKALCQKHNIAMFENTNKSTIDEKTKTLEIDYIFCFGFRRLIQNKVLKRANYAACSTHFALLPAYRGFAPVNWAIINGESNCGVSLFHMEDKMDSGDIVAQKSVSIEPDAYVDEVMDKCIETLTEILKEIWPKFLNGDVTHIKQDETKATYTCARSPEDGLIQWKESSKTILNLIRGCSMPFPGAYTYYQGKKLIIWRATYFDTGVYVGRIAGKVVKHIQGQGVVVLTGDGALLLETVQYGERHMSADELIKSVRVTLGQ